MAEPTSFKGYTGYRLLIQFNAGIWGWTEQYFLWYPSVATAWAQAMADAKTIVIQRQGILTSAASIVGYRVQQLGPGAVGSRRVTDRGAGCGIGQVIDAKLGTTGPEPVWDGVIINLWDATFTYRRSLILRGLPSQWVTFDVAGGPALTGTGVGSVKMFLQFIQGTAVDSSGAALVTGTPSLYGRSHDPVTVGYAAAAALPSVTAAALNPTCGTDITTVTAQNVVWKAGDLVHIHQSGCDVCHVKGLAKDACVTKTVVTGAGPYTTVTTIGARPCCCMTPIPLPAKTTMYKVVKGFYNIGASEPGRLVKRNTGGAYGAGKGRSRSCARN